MKPLLLFIPLSTPSVIFSQVEGLPAGMSGWATFVVTLPVLAWLLFVHLPNNAKQLKEWMTAASAERTEAAAERKRQLDEQTVERAATLKLEQDERDKEREARHKVADKAQELVLGVTMRFEKMMSDTREQHRQDAEKDRVAFEHRQNSVVDAMRIQTAELKQSNAELKAAILTGMGCRWQGECENYVPKGPQTHKPTGRGPNQS